MCEAISAIAVQLGQLYAEPAKRVPDYLLLCTTHNNWPLTYHRLCEKEEHNSNKTKRAFQKLFNTSAECRTYKCWFRKLRLLGTIRIVLAPFLYGGNNTIETATWELRVAGEPFVWTDKTELKVERVRSGQNKRNNTGHRHSVAPGRVVLWGWGWVRCRLVAQSISLVVFYLFLVFSTFPNCWNANAPFCIHFDAVVLASCGSSSAGCVGNGYGACSVHSSCVKCRLWHKASIYFMNNSRGAVGSGHIPTISMNCKYQLDCLWMHLNM